MNEPQKVPSYRIEFEKIADYDELILQFNRVRRTAIYQHKEHFPETAVILCISKNQGYMCKKTTVKTANGGYRKSFVRDECNPLYNSCIPHEVSPHIHFQQLVKVHVRYVKKWQKMKTAKLKSVPQRFLVIKPVFQRQLDISQNKQRAFAELEIWKIIFRICTKFCKKTPRKPYNHKGFSDFQKCSVIII